MLAQLEEETPSRAATEGVAGLPAEESSNVLRTSAQAADFPSVQGAYLEETSVRAGAWQDADVAARVNGKTIFVSEVLERYRPQLEAQRGRVSQTAYDQMRRQLLEQELDGHVEQALVLSAARAQFKQDQWDKLQDKLDEFFYQDEVPSLQKRLGATSLQDLDEKLQAAGTTLSAYRRVWGDRQIAGQWVSERLPDASVSRPELLAEYQQRRESYREPEQVKWQECRISIAASGGEAAARERLQQAIAGLKAGESFDSIVAAYSDGSQASQGGHWDWTQPSSLADERLRDVLKTIQLDQIGPVLQDERGFRLVKLTGYRPERVVPFEDVQKELREAVVQRKREAAAHQVIEKLKAEAHIETIFDRHFSAG